MGPPKTYMDEKTTKKGKQAGGNDITTSSPYGQEELQQAHNAELADSDDVDVTQPQKRPEGVHTVDMPQNRNPKHTGRSPRTE